MTVKETLRQYHAYAPVKRTTIRLMSGRQQVLYDGLRRKVPRQIGRQNVMARVRFGNEVLLWISARTN